MTSITSPKRDIAIIVDRSPLATTLTRPLAFCPTMAYNEQEAAANQQAWGANRHFAAATTGPSTRTTDRGVGAFGRKLCWQRWVDSERTCPALPRLCGLPRRNHAGISGKQQPPADWKHKKGIALAGDFSEPLISAAELERRLTEGSVVLLDARGGPDAAARFAQAAIPGARRVDLESELSAPFTDAAVGGRHPLPDYERFVRLVESWGIGPDSAVVVCDDKGGGNAAARAWWMLRAIGLQKVAVLDGGCQLYPRLTAGNPEVPASAPRSGLPIDRGSGQWQWPLASIDEVERASLTASVTEANCDNAPTQSAAIAAAVMTSGTSNANTLSASNPLIVDVREAFRYRGDSEPIDLVAGHIPGAMNCPFLENLDSSGKFLSPSDLRTKYQTWLANRCPADVIVHCGSGVTACHTLLAMAIAGLPGARLYVGSWSQWSRNNKPMATGS